MIPRGRGVEPDRHRRRQRELLDSHQHLGSGVSEGLGLAGRNVIGISHRIGSLTAGFDERGQGKVLLGTKPLDGLREPAPYFVSEQLEEVFPIA